VIRASDSTLWEKIVPTYFPAMLLLFTSAPLLAGDTDSGVNAGATETPISADPRLVVERFTSAPEIVQPIALDFDAKGRLLVIESHTHFRPAKYDGPRYDRIRMFEVRRDGKHGPITTFYEGTTHTMDLAVHPDGSVYLATRNEILRLRDTNGDGKADESTRIVYLDTKGNYPHNGLSGLSFDPRGDLNFGIGENLGADYKLIGSDGTTLTGGGEGGNVYHCTADGKALRRVATGFWNPFGSCRDIFGRLFVVDNDPDSSPPCRLVHVVEGGDYGFQFRYGRAGRHPFQAWNGELPGTLPFVAGTGESPCEVISYESDGLPSEYRGELLVPAWADHRVERYTLKPKGASFTAERKPFIQGGKDFYPSGLTVAPDGSLFVSDWGSRSYELHGKGAIWHIRWKDAKAVKRPADPNEAILSADRKTRDAAGRMLAKDDDGREFLRKQLASKEVRLRASALTALIAAEDHALDLAPIALQDKDDGIREMALRALVARGKNTLRFAIVEQPAGMRAEAIAGVPPGKETNLFLPDWLASPDPFIRHAAVRTLTSFRVNIDPKSIINSNQRIGVLLAWRAWGGRMAAGIPYDFLKADDPDVRFLAIKWVADERLTRFRPQIVEMLTNRKLDPREFIGLTTALARIDGKPVNEDSLAGYFAERLADKSAPASVRLMALRSISANDNRLKLDQLTDMLQQDDPAFRIEALRALKDRADPKAAPTVLAIARDEKEPLAVRAQALVTLAATNDANVNLMISLADEPHGALRHEALRGLVQTKLSANQQAKLTMTLKGHEESRDLAKRVLGKPFAEGRPAPNEIDAWLKRLEGPCDPEAGRRTFEHPKLTGCFRCHRVDGRGADVGPDLSLIGRTDRRWIVESLLQPSAVVAPHYQTWKITTTDERSRMGLLVRTYLDETEYIDEKGSRFKVLATDVAEVKAANISIMPEGLVDQLTDQEIRDLVAYLASRK